MNSSIKDAAPQTYQALEGARGVAALLVALYHYPFTGALHDIAVVRHGWTAVDLFFVMSGFIMATTYAAALQTADQRRRFALKRVGRLYPLHLVTLAAAILFPFAIELLREALVPFGVIRGEFVREEPIFQLGSFLTNLLLVQALGLHNHLTYNTPAWSISTEFWTYAVFALTCAAATMSRRKLAWAGLAALGMTVVLLQPAHDNLNITYDYAIFRCFAGFFLGALVGQWRLDRPVLPRLPLLLMQVTAVAAYLAVTAGAESRPRLTMALPLIFVPVVLTLSYDVGPVARLLSSQPLRWLGTISYSVYMVHEVVLLNLVFPIRSRLPAIFGHDLTAAIAYVAVVLLIAVGTYRWIEVPARDWFRDRAAGTSRRV